MERLFEHLAISPLIRLAVDLNRLVPRPLVFDECLIFRLAGIELGKGIALIIWGDIESWQCLLSTDQESTLDNAIIGNSKDGSSTKDVFTRSFEASKETTYCTLVKGPK
jgi:hypothetical protein